MISTHSTKSRVNSIRDPLCDQSHPYRAFCPKTNGGLNAVIKNANVDSTSTNFCGRFKFLKTQSKYGFGTSGAAFLGVRGERLSEF
jgi:hypothetical protein